MSAQRINVATVAHGIRELTEWLGRGAYLIAPPLLRIALAIPFRRTD